GWPASPSPRRRQAGRLGASPRCWSRAGGSRLGPRCTPWGGWWGPEAGRKRRRGGGGKNPPPARAMRRQRWPVARRAGPGGWAAALLAVLTAYVGVLGGSLGLPQDYAGPMAKQHRMAVMTVAAVLGAAEAALGAPARVLLVALVVVVVGSAATVIRRTYRIV